MWYTQDAPIKLTGFVDRSETEYVEYPKREEVPSEDLKPYDVSFKFAFLIDDEKVYEYIWDGTQYPKFIRNTVDLQNSDSMYRNSDPDTLNFSQSLNKRLTYGKEDYTYVIIKSIINATTRKDNSYTHYDMYGDKKIDLTNEGFPFNKSLMKNFWYKKKN